MSRSSSCWQWHGYCRFAGHDDFALCSLCRQQACGVFAAIVPAVCCQLGCGVDCLRPWHKAKGHVPRDMTLQIRCIRAVVSTKTLLLHLVRTTTTTTNNNHHNHNNHNHHNKKPSLPYTSADAQPRKFCYIGKAASLTTFNWETGP